MVTVDTNDSAIVSMLDGDSYIKTASGLACVRRCLVRTPCGVHEGVCVPGATRLLPVYLIASEQNSYFKWEGAKLEVRFRGIDIPSKVVNKIPYIEDLQIPTVQNIHDIRLEDVRQVNTAIFTKSPATTLHSEPKIFHPVKFFSYNNILYQTFLTQFQTNKKTVKFSDLQLATLDVMLDHTQVHDDMSLRSHLQQVHGCRVQPIMVLPSSACHSGERRSDKISIRDAYAQALPIRLSMSHDGTYTLADWRVPPTDSDQQKVAIHVYFRPVSSLRGCDVSNKAVYSSIQLHFHEELATVSEEVYEFINSDHCYNSCKARVVTACPLHKCEEGWNPNCINCVRAGLRVRHHKRQKGPFTIGKLCFDLQLFSKKGPFVAVGAIKEQDKTFAFAEPIAGKTVKEIKRAIVAMIFEAETWGITVRRIHSDRERAVAGEAGDQMAELGIRVTLTEGFAPQSNGQVEAIGGLLAMGARVRLQQFQEVPEKLLWPSAMVHAAMSWNARVAPEKCPYQFILPFGSKVESRWAPKVKLDKVAPRTYPAVYLHPSKRTPKGHVVVRAETEGNVVTLRDTKISTQIVQNKTESTTKLSVKFPRGVRRYPAERTALLESAHIGDEEEATDEDVDEEEEQGLRRSTRLKEVRIRKAAEARKKTAAKAKVFSTRLLSAFSAFGVSTAENLQEAWSSINALISNRYELEPTAFNVEVGFDEDELLEEGLAALLREDCLVTKLLQNSEHSTPEGIEAFKKEFASLVKNQVLGKPISRADIPEGSELGRLFGILSMKEVETVNPELKARVVFQGNKIQIMKNGRLVTVKEKQDIEPDDTWVRSAACHEAVRIFLGLSLTKGWKTYSCDLKSAYLQAKTEGRKVFALVPDSMINCLPESLKEEASKMKNPVFALDRALYGRVRSGKDWGSLIEKTLAKMGFEPVKSSRGLYKSKQFALVIYVDDMAITAPEHVAAEFFKRLEDEGLVLKETAHGTWTETTRFLGVEYTRFEDDAFRYLEVHMEGYVDNLIKQFEERTGRVVRPRTTLPTEPKVPQNPLKGYDFRIDVGGLLWLQRCCRPDISRPLGIIGSSIECWSEEMLDFLTALYGYVLHTKDHCLLFQYNKQDKAVDLVTTTHADASLAVPRSVGGSFTCVTSNSGTFLPIQWQSKKQTLCATSSAAAEFISLSHAVENTIPVDQALKDLGIVHSTNTASCFCDNNSVLLAIGRAYSNFDSVYSRAVNLRLYQLSDLQDQGVVQYFYVNTLKNIADALTKLLGGAAMSRARTMFNVVPRRRTQE